MRSDTSAFQLVFTGDPALLAIVRLSLIVSLSAVAFAALVAVPFGAFVALNRFSGREVVIVLMNALMGLPPVVAGLGVYLLLSRSGPLGPLGLLFTLTAMVIAQTILVTPIIAALARQTIEDLWDEYRDELTAMNVGPFSRVTTLVWDGRFSFKAAEEKFLSEGFGVKRYPVMYNDFVLIGPKSDPAGVKGKDILTALQTIKAKQVPFISRGDRSGTNIAEVELWKDAGIDIAMDKGPWYREIGQGMGAALNTASAMNAYVLSDRGTWLAFNNRGDLGIMVEGDKRLRNQYGVMLVNPAKHPSVKKDLGQQFIDWLVSVEGQNAMPGYKINGQQLFYPNANEANA